MPLATQDASKAGAHATTSQEDPPVEINTTAHRGSEDNSS